MGLSETEEIYKKHQHLCADLNLDKESSSTSWNNYLATKHNYTLEGNQLHWLACSIYVACRKSSAPAIGRTNTLIEGNLVSLTRLLRICDLKLIQFIEKCRKWANMVGLAADFRSKINCLERKYAVSAVVFKKFRAIFYEMFKNPEPSTDPDKMKVAKKGKGITCTTTRLMEFAWTLYLVVKSEYPDISEDLVNSVHLLLACCDMIYANAISSDRRDILNDKFIGLPEHSFDEDYDPPVEPICIIDELCKIYQGIAIEAKGVREYNWKPQIRKLFERGVLKGDSSNFTEIFHSDVFDSNYRSINKSYEQYVLSVGDFDERVMVLDSQTDDSGENAASGGESAATGGADTMDDTDRPSIIYPSTLTPLTGRQYLKNRDSLVNVTGNTPMINAKEKVIRLQTILTSRRISLRQCLHGKVKDETITEIESEVRRNGVEMRDMIIEYDSSKSTDFTRRRVEMAEKLFYKMLEDIAQEEIKMSKPDVSESLRQGLFLRSLFACAMELVVFSHNSSVEFAWILEALDLHAYHFYKIIELVVRTESQLSRDMVKHLNMVEEKILESMSWKCGSPLWKTIEESNMPIPVCEEVCLPHQLSSFEAAAQRPYQNIYRSGRQGDFKSTAKCGSLAKPKRGGSLGLFFRKFYHLASVRMQDLCDKLNINDKDVRLKIWTCFEYVIVNYVNLMKNRHLDQILMCTVYVVCKVLEINLTFQEIMKCYRNQPQAVSSIYRDVLLHQPSTPAADKEPEGDATITTPTAPTTPERGDLIKFYNQVYVKVIQTFALKFSTKSSQKGEQLNLSPLPVSKSKTNSPFRRISDKHPIYIRCLDNADSIPPSPVKPLEYYFSRSPAKDLQAINNMIQIGAVKRNLNIKDEDDDDPPPIKRVVPRNGSTKLQDLIEDRKECKY